MLRLLFVCGLYVHGHGWWGFSNTTKPVEPTGYWTQFEERMPRIAGIANGWYDWGNLQASEFSQTLGGFESVKVEFNAWMILDAIVSFFGWAIFGSAWTSVKSGCRRIVQICTVVMVCLAAHYVWAVCFPIVSIFVGLVMALVWILRKVIRMVGTTFFHVQRLAGGVPEAADVEFVGPGSGVTPETAVLRSFKRTGDQPKQIVLKRGSEVVLCHVGTENPSIRTHGLYLSVEPDSLRGSPELVRCIGRADKVHLCRSCACPEEGGEHFTEYGLVKKFNAERFQFAQSQQEARGLSKRLWSWINPQPLSAATKVFHKLKEYASESENEDCGCQANKVTWTTEAGDEELLANTKCTAVGTQFHQILEDDKPVGSDKVFLWSKHTTLYLTKRSNQKCGSVGCNKVGKTLHFGARWCQLHKPSNVEHEAPKPSRSSRSRSRSRPKSQVQVEEDEDMQEAEEDGDEEMLEDERGRARDLLRGAAADSEHHGSRSRRRAPTRSPGHTPKSNIQRSLARLGMLSSPGSEIKLLEEFMELFAQGSEKGIKEEEVRARLGRDRLLSEEEVLKRLVHEADLEQAKGQRGLTRFLRKWKKEADRLVMQESSRAPSDWSVVDGDLPKQATPSTRSTPSIPPMPASFQDIAPVDHTSAARASVEEKGTPKGEVRIAAPSIYKADRKAGAVTASPTPEPVEQIAKALQHQTAELATLVRHQAEGAGTQPQGTLKGLNKQSEEIVFLELVVSTRSSLVRENTDKPLQTAFLQHR